ncbi:MAG TPA: hypothetical protein PKD52_01085 [Clostridiales bacterium]|nr:hypothetical protein [Clostridiales bacterium]
MTIKEIMAFVDDIKPNAFSNQQKTVWLNEVEGMVQTDVMLLAPSTVVSYVYEAAWSGTGIAFPDSATLVFPTSPQFRAGGTVTITGLLDYASNNQRDVQVKSISVDGRTLHFEEGTFGLWGDIAETATATVTFDGSNTMPLIEAPHHKIYYTYLMAMIDFANGEYGKYQNTMTLFNTFLSGFSKWYVENYQPGNGKCLNKGYYLSAYAIAVKHGFYGSEEDFLYSLKGEKGETGNSIRGFAKSSGTGAPGTTDTYTITMTDGNTLSFTVYNGRDGNMLTVDSGLSSLSANPVQNSVIKASLDNKADLVDGVIPASQLPSYVDDVIELISPAQFPPVGESGKIYVTQYDNKTWRWTGSTYVEISQSIALGETSSTAYRGDRGKTAYDHSQVTGNPHGTTATQINLADVGGYFTTDTVEAALQQIGSELNGLAAALEGLL